MDLRFYHLPKGRGHHQYWWDNTDELISSYQGAVGIKTGYTDDAGHCLLFEAIRNGRALIGAVLDSPATGPAAGAQDAGRMLNWGFRLRRGLDDQARAGNPVADGHAELPAASRWHRAIPQFGSFGQACWVLGPYPRWRWPA